jgi:glutamyl-tRNA reductase
VATAVADTPAAGEVAQARELVAEEVSAYMAWQHARRVEPTIAALRARAERIRLAELERLSPKLAELDDRQRAAVEQLSRGILNTLLHEPTVRLKAASVDDRGGWQAEVVRDLFSLNDPASNA